MIKNIIANFLGRFWSILSNFLFLPLYIHYLGFVSYSIISFTLVIAGVMSLLDVGLTATLSREFARTDNLLEDKIRIFKTIESTYFIIIGISILLVIASSSLIAFKWLNLGAYNPQKVSFYLKIISFDVGFQMLLRFYMGGLLGLEKQVKANLYQIGWGVLRNGLVVIAIMFVPTLGMFFVWQSLSTIIFAVLFKLSLETTLHGHLIFEIDPKIEVAVFKRIWRFVGGMMLISLVASLNTQMDKIAISKLLSVENLGYYTLAVSLAQGISILVSPISMALLPRFTALYSTNKSEEASNLFHKVSLFISILVFSLMSNIAFFSKELIWIWTGKTELALNSYALVPIISFAYAILSLQMIPFNIAIANGYTKLNNLLGIISLLVTIPGYWIATKHSGAIGAAYVFCVVQFIITLVYLYFINEKFLGNKSILHIYFKELSFPLVISIIIAFGFSLIPNQLNNSRIISFSLIGIYTIITFSLTSLILIPMRDIKSIVNLQSLFSKPV